VFSPFKTLLELVQFVLLTKFFQHSETQPVT